ncbi:MAG TPA: ATP-binding protein [Polyangiales bacterium]|nr:ATP-binding protein [Polyangiales bacterium]
MIDWFCNCLGLPFIAEEAGGGLGLNAAAHDVLGTGAVASIGAALRPLLGDRLDVATLDAALQAAREGRPTELTLAQGLRALVAPAAPGRACAVLAPQVALEGLALQRRALATDRSARISHELANALGAIAGWAAIAKESQRVDEALDLIERSASDAWTAARTMLGEVSGQRATPETDQIIDLSHFTEQASRLLVPTSLKKRVTIDTQVTPGLLIKGDRSSAWAIVWNLTANAIEALHEGGRVSLQLTDAGDTLRLCVQDDGPGMSAEVRAHVFEPYFSTKDSGAGLGLALVKQAVHALGGNITLDSEPGRGTCFCVELPRARSNSVAPKRKLSTRESGVYVAEAIEGRILVLDDDASLREMIATALQMRGAQVESAATLDEALQMRGPFDVAVIDYILGDERGDAAIAALRATSAIARTLLVTGTELPRQLADGGEPDGVLRKPFELNDLFERVSGLLLDEAVRRSRTA